MEIPEIRHRAPTVACAHHGFHTGQARYCHEHARLRYVLTCDECFAEVRQVDVIDYRPRFDRDGNARRAPHGPSMPANVAASAVPACARPQAQEAFRYDEIVGLGYFPNELGMPVTTPQAVAVAAPHA